MLVNLLFAGLGGFIGAGCRFLVGELLKFFLVVGILGGFTTFSSFSLDSVKFLLEGELVKGFLNIFLNLSLCLLASYFGILLGKNL